MYQYVCMYTSAIKYTPSLRYMMVVFHHDEPEIMNILTLARRRDLDNYKILSVKE